MFWTPFHLQEFESAVKKLEQNSNRIHLSPVQAISIRKVIEQIAFDKGVKFPNIVSETKDVLAEHAYNVYEDVSQNAEYGLYVSWNAAQIQFAKELLLKELQEHGHTWNTYKEENNDSLQRMQSITEAIEKTYQTDELVEIKWKPNQKNN